MKVADLQIRQLPTIQSINPGQQVNRANETNKPGKPTFSEVFQSTLKDHEGLRFSAHALKRLNHRGIELDGLALNRLEEGVKKMELKGAKNSLILMDDNAFIVNVKNRVVVTALEKNSTQGNVFTNIDGVAIM